MAWISWILFILNGIFALIYLAVKIRKGSSDSSKRSRSCETKSPEYLSKKGSQFYKVRASELRTLNELGGVERRMRENVADLLELCKRGYKCEGDVQETCQAKGGYREDGSSRLVTEVTKVYVDELADTLRGLKIPLVIQDRDRVVVVYKKNPKL